LQAKREKLMLEWGLDPVPDEQVPLMSGTFNAPIYALDTWGKLFNLRQQLALITFTNAVRRAHASMIATDYRDNLAMAVTTYLAMILSRHSSYNASLCWWETTGERSFNVFGRQALPMVFDYSEQCPYGPLTGNWISQTETCLEII